jgi:hypothetical protein
MKTNLTLALLLTPLIFFGMNTQANGKEEVVKTEKTCMVKTVDGGERKCTKKEKKKHKKHKKHEKKKHNKKHQKKHEHKKHKKEEVK